MEREEQEAWELAKQLVQIDSSDPGAYEEEIGCLLYTSPSPRDRG